MSETTTTSAMPTPSEIMYRLLAALHADADDARHVLFAAVKVRENITASSLAAAILVERNKLPRNDKRRRKEMKTLADSAETWDMAVLADIVTVVGPLFDLMNEAYEHHSYFRALNRDFAKVRAAYRSLPGWQEIEDADKWGRAAYRETEAMDGEDYDGVQPITKCRMTEEDWTALSDQYPEASLYRSVRYTSPYASELRGSLLRGKSATAAREMIAACEFCDALRRW